MNVNELISALSEIEDKTLEVRMEDWNEDYQPPFPVDRAELSEHFAPDEDLFVVLLAKE